MLASHRNNDVGSGDFVRSRRGAASTSSRRIAASSVTTQRTQPASQVRVFGGKVLGVTAVPSQVVGAVASTIQSERNRL